MKEKSLNIVVDSSELELNLTQGPQLSLFQSFTIVSHGCPQFTLTTEQNPSTEEDHKMCLKASEKN